MTKFILWFAPHIRQRAIIYVFVCYGIFAGLNLFMFRMDDPYGIAMIIIGVFWLVVIKFFDIAESFIITR